MIDKAAIETLQASQAVTAVNAALATGFTTNGLAVIPGGMSVEDLEDSMPAPRRMKGTMTTAVLKAFAEYTAKHAIESASHVFINDAEMHARAIFDHGVSGAPMHGSHHAVFAPRKTSEYTALLAITGRDVSQKDLAEWVEDYVEGIVHVVGSGGEAITVAQAATAIRSVTIESMARSNNKQEQLSAERSEFESVKASTDKGAMPVTIMFNCYPYADLSPQDFQLRLSIVAGEKSPRLRLAIVRFEAHLDAMAQELCEVVTGAIKTTAKTVDVSVGSFSKRI